MDINLTVSALVDENGRSLGKAGVGKDMTEQNMLYYKLFQSEKLAGVGILASGIAHEMNNPLAGILGMAKAMENSLKMARHSFSVGSVQIRTGYQNDCFVLANEGEMQQVFVNLMVNAIHAMGDKGTLSVGCGKEGDFVKAVITDTGKGIPKENLKFVFDPFFTTKPAGKGTGLGLFVTYKIVAKHGGTIKIDSAEGRGTSFILKFRSSGK